MWSTTSPDLAPTFARCAYTCLPFDGGPTVTTASPGARVISVNPAGRIPGTFQAQVRIGKADSKGVNTFTISAGQVRRDVVVGVQ